MRRGWCESVQGTGIQNPSSQASLLAIRHWHLMKTVMLQQKEKEKDRAGKQIGLTQTNGDRTKGRLLDLEIFYSMLPWLR
jgi:hypothetical protein